MCLGQHKTTFPPFLCLCRQMGTQKLSRMHPQWPGLFSAAARGMENYLVLGKLRELSQKSSVCFLPWLRGNLYPRLLLFPTPPRLGTLVTAFMWCRIDGLSAVRDRMSSKGLCLSNPLNKNWRNHLIAFSASLGISSQIYLLYGSILSTVVLLQSLQLCWAK